MILDWTSALQSALTTLLAKISYVIPNLVGAFLIFVIGLMLASLIGGMITTLIEKIKVDKALEKPVIQPIATATGITINTAKVFGELTKWFVLIIVFMAVADIANLPQINHFFNNVLVYLPNVFAAVAILVVSSLLANFTGNIITAFVKEDIGYYSGLARAAIYTFAVLAALHQLQISKPLIEILFTGIIATGVLAFGLGGKEVAGEILKKAYGDFKAHKK